MKRIKYSIEVTTELVAKRILLYKKFGLNASEIEREFGVCRKSCERAVRAYKEGRKINMNRNSKEKFRKMINKVDKILLEIYKDAFAEAIDNM